MRIIEVIIDGFKSYAVRTVISGWDESFNSITGLNGSGKSNILDSICFVLGITNMSTVRAQNLQDLIYKRGQAGVTKASVTIVFDNKDKKKSPIGFEEYAQISVTRQIVLGGTSKYLINGHRAQQHTVQNLFQSVQLNINNPNFLIMQGRITKVLNMKPQEILSMIEEAAGTRMFEDRRDKAFKTMAKKENKVQEITSLLKEEIDPKLEKLRQEKRAFLDFQQTQNDLERMTKIVVAYDYIRNKDRAAETKEDLQTKKKRIEAIGESAERLRSEMNYLQEDIEKVKAERDKELRKGGRFQELEDKTKAHSHEIVRLSTVIDLKKSSLVEDEQRHEDNGAAIEDLESQLQAKTQSFEESKQKFEAANQELAAQTAEAEKKEELLQTLQTGVTSKEGQESGYQGQLHEARARLNTAATEQEQAKLQISHLEKRIKEEEPRAKEAKKQNSGLMKELDGLRSQSEKLKADLAKLGLEPDREEQCRRQETALQHRIRDLQRQADVVKQKVAGIDFTYSDPVANFDRSKVKGLLAQLFTLDKQHAQAGTALEICAGGRLYNVVVDTAQTGSQILEKGKLRKRVTIIPLNKISAFKASADKIGAAQKLAPGKVNLALELIGYEAEVSAAMEYVFGSTLVCADADTAKRVTFDPSVRLKSVTLEGDVYDPAGTLSGGSAPQSSGVLLTLQKLNLITKDLEAAVTELAQVQGEMARDQKKMAKAREIKQSLDLKAHEIELTETQINGNSASDIIAAVEEMQSSIAKAREDINNAKVQHGEAAQDIKRIEKDMNEFSKNKDGKLVELQTSLEKLKKVLSKTASQVKPLQQEMRAAKGDVEQCTGDLAAAREAVEETAQSLTSLRSEIESLVTAQNTAKEDQDMAQAELDDERARLSGFDEELKALEETSRAKNNQLTEEGLESQKLGHALEKVQKDQQTSSGVLAQLEKEYEWIADEKGQFGKTGTAYDFRNQNMAECKASLKNVLERHQGMKKKINPKVMQMIDGVEKKEAALKNMMKTVIRDKTKIEETIESLDEYKKEALEKTWRKVNGDFGHIFADLLPGSFAKLDPCEGKGISEGLEVKVCLGKVWKQSLAELSGGQRSLVALSLIMALLQFKPAPMYILDEVDAALDLSHTQNIGRLIKERFKGSQFIVVSLKDGMFQNANRIFRTRFSEGTSVVQALTPAEMK